MKKNAQEVMDWLREYAKTKLGFDEEVTEATTPIDLAADSLDFAEFVVESEREFSVSLPESAVEKIANMGQFRDAIVAALPD